MIERRKHCRVVPICPILVDVWAGPMPEMEDWMWEEICKIFGVPPIILGNARACGPREVCVTESPNPPKL